MAGSKGVISPKTLTTGRLRVSLDKEIDKLDYDQAILLKLSKQVSKKPVKRMTFNWLTKERKADWGGIASYGGAWAAGANKAGTIVVTAGEGWMYGPGDIIKCPVDSDVNIYVDSVSTDTLTCHTYDDSTTIDFSAGSTGTLKILLIGNTFELGSGKGTMKSHQPETNLNYIQIIQTPYGVVETLEHVETDAGGPELKEREEDAFLDHMLAMEKLFFFGQKHATNTGYMDGLYEQYFTGGLLEACTSNVETETQLTQAEFGAWVNDCLLYAKKPVIFAGAIIFEALSWWLGQKLQTRQDEHTLGVSVANYVNEYGDTVTVIPHKEILKNSYAGHAFSVDLADIGYRFLEGEDTHLETGIADIDLKQTINEYRTWMGVYLGNEKRHGVLKGVTSIAA